MVSVDPPPGRVMKTPGTVTEKSKPNDVSTIYIVKEGALEFLLRFITLRSSVDPPPGEVSRSLITTEPGGGGGS